LTFYFPLLSATPIKKTSSHLRASFRYQKLINDILIQVRVNAKAFLTKNKELSLRAKSPYITFA